MLFGHGLQCHIFVNMLGVSPYSVDAGFNSSGRSYCWCNMKARCGRDVFLRDHTTSVRNFKWKMMSQTHDVIYQNDLQKLRNWCISHKNGVRTTWKKLWFVKGNKRELLIFCYKMGCVKTALKLVPYLVIFGISDLAIFLDLWSLWSLPYGTLWYLLG
jgi:hypothetical protein